MKTIWIFNQYAATPETGMSGRNYYLARELGKLGHRVYLVAARWHHLLYDEHAAAGAPTLEQRDYFTFVRVPMPKYGHAHHPKRVLNWLFFIWRIRQLPNTIPDRPDVVIYSSPSLPGYLGAEAVARKFDAQLIFEVRDLFPLTLVQVGGRSERHPFVRWLQWIEDRAYRNADKVVSNLKFAVDHMIVRGMASEKFSWIPNGIDPDEVSDPQPLSPSIMLAIPKDTFKVGYVGTIGAANQLDVMVDAAIALRDRSDITFLIVGKGKDRESIENRIRENGLTNIQVMGPIDKPQVQSMLTLLDACYIGLINKSLFKFGVSPNKLFDYMLAGKPIIYGIDSGAYHPIDDIQAGIEIQPGCPEKLAEATTKLMELSDVEREAMGERAKSAALKQYNYVAAAKQYEDLILDI